MCPIPAQLQYVAPSLDKDAFIELVSSQLPKESVAIRSICRDGLALIALGGDMIICTRILNS